MKFRELLEINEYFKYLTNDYIAIAKIHKIGKDHLKIIFKDKVGAKNAYDDIRKDDKPGYHTVITNNVVEILIGDYN